MYLSSSAEFGGSFVEFIFTEELEGMFFGMYRPMMSFALSHRLAPLILR
jgi:hypothetical protein